MHQQDEYPAVGTLRPGLPRELERIVNRMLAKNADSRYQDAEELFVRALRRDPSYSEAYGNLATLYDRAHRSDLAEPLYRKALALSPKNYRARNNYSVHLVGKGDEMAASRELEKAKVVVTDVIIESNIGKLKVR